MHERRGAPDREARTLDRVSPNAPPKPFPWALVLGVVVLGGTCVGYPIGKIRWARRAVDGYCAAVAPGNPVAGLAQRATDARLQVIEVAPRKDDDGKVVPGRLLLWEGWVFARRFCNIDHDGTSVTRVSSASLD